MVKQNTVWLDFVEEKVVYLTLDRKQNENEEGTGDHV